MRRILCLVPLLVLLALAVAPSAASAYTCKSPQHEPHGGPVYPLILTTFVAEEEIYMVAEYNEAGCADLIVEEPEGELARRRFRWFPTGMGGLVPHIPFGQFVCYELEQTEAEPARWSNRLCVYPLEHERLD